MDTQHPRAATSRTQQLTSRTLQFRPVSRYALWKEPVRSGEGKRQVNRLNRHRLLERWPRLRAAYRAYRASKQLYRPPVITPYGFQLVGSPAMQQGVFEPAETRLVQELLPEVDILINVGANVGYYCCLALAQGKRVVAFEPLPNNLELLFRNIELNGWEEQIEVFPLALGPRPGIAKLYGGGTGASLVQGWAGQAVDDSTRVPISTLDLALGERFQGKPCLVLVDIEGAELGMLQGASRLLGNQPSPLWIVEISVTEHQPAGTTINPHLYQTFELFAQAGYQAFTADHLQREVTLNEVAEVERTRIDSLNTHNFIFRCCD